MAAITLIRSSPLLRSVLPLHVAYALFCLAVNGTCIIARFSHDVANVQSEPPLPFKLETAPTNSWRFQDEPGDGTPR